MLNGVELVYYPPVQMTVQPKGQGVRPDAHFTDGQSAGKKRIKAGDRTFKKAALESLVSARSGTAVPPRLYAD